MAFDTVGLSTDGGLALSAGVSWATILERCHFVTQTEERIQFECLIDPCLANDRAGQRASLFFSGLPTIGLAH